MDRLTKLLITAIGIAVAQTVIAAAFFRSEVAAVSTIFCWVVVVVVARRRGSLTWKS